MDRIYLDNAATTFPKPNEVYEEAVRCMKEYCGNPGRSGHYYSREASEAVYTCREELSSFFELDKPENVIFTLNTTYALNLAINALITPNCHVIISDIEHNSVIRPVKAKGVEYDTFNAYRSETGVLSQIRSLIRPNTRMIICTHQSNICPLRTPISAIGKLCRERGIYFIVDAAQSAGTLPVSMKRSNIDALCVPGHKGLYGIQGCGALLLSQRAASQKNKLLAPLITGGNGVNSLEGQMPEFLPERFEAGTLATPSIAALLAGIRSVKKTGIARIREHEYSLYRRAREALLEMKNVRLYCPEFASSQILLFNIRNMPASAVANALDAQGICVRSGFHCAPTAHKYLATGPDGAVRASFGAFNTMKETDIFTDTLYRISKTIY